MRQRDGLKRDVAIVLKIGVDRDQIVLAVYFDSVAGVIEHRHISALRRAAELLQRAAHGFEAEIFVQR